MSFRGAGYVPFRLPFYPATDLILSNVTGSDQITTLNENAIYRNITLNASGAGKTILITAGFSVFCDVLTLTNNKCIVHNNGGSATDATSNVSRGTVGAGALGDATSTATVSTAQLGRETFWSTGAGGTGSVSATSNGTTPKAALNVTAYDIGGFMIGMGGAGGAGGDGSPANAWASGAPTVDGGLDFWLANSGQSAGRAGPFDPQNLLNGYVVRIGNTTTTQREVCKFAGGTGGGGGGSHGGGETESGLLATAGNGGAAGGGVYIFARRIDISGGGLIQANGGNGGRGYIVSTAVGATQGEGGGGGGGGGAIVLVYGELAQGSGQIQADGGNGGAHVGNGSNTAQGGFGGQGGAIFHLTDLGSMLVRGTNGANGA